MALPSFPDPERVDPVYLRQRARAVEEIRATLDLSGPEALNALRLGYDVVSDNYAPYIVRSATKMLPDLRADAEAGRTIVWLGRDAEYLRIATRVLAPELVDHHSRIALLNRTMAANISRDPETAGVSFPDLGSPSLEADPNGVPGIARRVTKYLQSSGIPVGQPGSAVTIVDQGFRGTIQETLAALYPETDFIGRYMFFAQSPNDPHPESKTGYDIHLGTDRSNGGNPTEYLPEEKDLTFQCNWSLTMLELTMQGPLSSPHRISEDGSLVQTLARVNSDPLRGINPILVPEILADPLVREGVLRVNLKAVEDCASRIVDVKMHGGDWQGALDRGSDTALSNIRAWLQGGKPDPKFDLLATSLSLKSDAWEVVEVASIIAQSEISDKDARVVWTSFNKLPTVEEKKAFGSALKSELLRITGGPSKELQTPLQIGIGGEQGTERADTGAPDRAISDLGGSANAARTASLAFPKATRNALSEATVGETKADRPSTRGAIRSQQPRAIDSSSPPSQSPPAHLTRSDAHGLGNAPSR